MIMSPLFSFFFFFNDTATTEIYTLSLHDALPISTLLILAVGSPQNNGDIHIPQEVEDFENTQRDRKSTRLNSSHDQISYAVFCLKKKKINNEMVRPDVRNKIQIEQHL